MYLYNTWEETGDESVECRALQKFLRQIELHKTGASCLPPTMLVFPFARLHRGIRELMLAANKIEEVIYQKSSFSKESATFVTHCGGSRESSFQLLMFESHLLIILGHC